MKKLLSLFFAAATFFGVSATEVTLDFTAQGYENAADVTSLTVDNVTITFDKGSNTKNGPKWYNTGSAVRLYTGNKMTVSCDVAITKAVITYSAPYNNNVYNFSKHEKATNAPEVVPVSSGTLSETDTEGTWTGNTTEFSIEVPNTGGLNGNARVAKVVVTTSGEATSVAPPTFDPAAGTYYSAQTVSIATTTSGATIYYTTNGSNPTTSSNVYSAPLNIAQTTTVKAFAVKGNLQSEVVTAEYVISSVPGVANVAAWAQLEENATAQLNSALNVFFVNGSNIYAKDATGYICLYGNDLKGKYKAGDVVPAGLIGVKKVYNYLLEMSYPFSNVQDATQHDVAVEADPSTVAAISTDVVGHFLKLTNVTISETSTTATDKLYNVTDASGATQKLYGTVAAGTYDYITVVVTYYKPKTGDAMIELLPVEIPIPPTDVDNLASLPSTADGVVYNVTNPVTVVAQSGPQLYVKDESAFMLVYDKNGKITHEYKNGDVVSGVNGAMTIYNGLSELVPFNDFSEGVAGPAVEPEAYPIEEVSTDMMHQYIKLLSVTMDSVANTQGRNFTLTDDTGDIVMRINGFDVVAPTDLDGHTFNVTGFVALYSKNNTTTLQIYPTEIEDLTAGILGDLNGDGNVNTGDVSALYTALLAGSVEAKYDLNLDGNVNTGDVSTLYSIILGN